MYIAFVAVYLLTCIKYDKYNKELYKPVEIDEKYKPIYANYTDLKKNAIDFNYCGLKSCLIKCCEDEQYLDSDGDCKDEQFFKDASIELGFGERYWDKVTKEISDRKKRLRQNFVFILRANRATAPKRNFTSGKSYLLENGELYYILDNSLHFSEVWPLHYCADYQINFQNEEKSVDFIFDMSKVPDLPQTDINNDEHIEYYVLGNGMLFTFILMVILVCCQWQRLRRRFVLFNLIANFISLYLAYALKMLYVGSDQDNCKVFSASLYFLLLSNFCWPLILEYNSLRALRHYRVTKKTWVEDDVVVFFRHSLFAWGLPLLVTLVALTVDIFDLGLVNPPFDNCFENEKETMVYLDVPISILIMVHTIVLLLYSYELLLVNSTLQNNPNFDKTKIMGHRSTAFRKLIASLGLCIILQYIPDVPSLLYYVTNSCIIVSSTIYLCVFLFGNMLLYYIMCRRQSSSNKYQVLEEDNSSIDPTKIDKIATISSNELDKKKPLSFTFTCNMDLAKDKILASIIPQDYEKIMDKTDLEKNGNESAIDRD